MEVSVSPKAFEDFFDRIAVRMRPLPTIQRILKEFIDIDVNAAKVSEILERNPYLEHLIYLLIQGLGLKGDVPSLRSAIAMVGMEPSRDFLCTVQLIRGVTGRHPPTDAEGKFSFKTIDYLKYAKLTEEYAKTHSLEYQDTAYAAGMVFDYIALLAKEHFKTAKPFEDFLDEIYRHGIKTARLGYEIAKGLKNLRASKYVFSGCLIHDIGKAVLFLQNPQSVEPSYAGFRKAISGGKTFPRTVIHVAEHKRFGISHEHYSSQIAYHFGIFREIERALLFHHDPYLIRRNDRALWEVACLVALSSNMANHFRIPKDTNDEVFQLWVTQELEGFKTDRNALFKIMHQVGRESF